MPWRLPFALWALAGARETATRKDAYIFVIQRFYLKHFARIVGFLLLFIRYFTTTFSIDGVARQRR
jgi:hypothetical protein